MTPPAQKWTAVLLLGSLGVLFFLCGTCISGEKFALSVPGNALKKNERVLSFKVTVSAGRIVSLREMPIGWDIHVDNDASWDTNISGNATVGAAALEGNFFKDFLVIEKAESPLGPFAIESEIGLYTEGTEEQRSVQLKMKDVRFRKLGKKK
jgi:hypothetical protein